MTNNDETVGPLLQRANEICGELATPPTAPQLAPDRVGELAAEFQTLVDRIVDALTAGRPQRVRATAAWAVEALRRVQKLVTGRLSLMAAAGIWSGDATPIPFEGIPALPGALPPVSQPGPQVSRVGRNDPCPCGSRKKVKNCCSKMK